MKEFRPRLNQTEWDVIQRLRASVNPITQKQVPNHFANIPKILLLDIETLFGEARIWHTGKQRISHQQITRNSCILSWVGKWLYDAEMMSDILTPGEAVARDDKRILDSVWKALDTADVVVGHNCVGINTPILKQDLTWVNAGELNIGDKLVGFEEKTPPEIRTRVNNKWVGVGNKNRNIIPTTITDFSIINSPCMEIVFGNGDKVITTKDHYWLGMAEHDRNQRWYKTENLRVGQRVNKYFNVWERDLSYESGWLSGFISGEGSLKVINHGLSIDFCQRPGETWNQALDFCKQLNIPLSSYRKPKTGGLGKQDTLYTGMTGGKFKTLEYIGKLNIKRFIEKINWSKIGGLRSPYVNTNTIIEINNVGLKEVAVITTTSKTFFAAGYPMHNCRRFDVRMLNARFFYHKMTPPLPYRTVDTLIESQKNFKLFSYKLDYISKLINNQGKLETDYELWIKCADGDQESLDYMLAYNKGDVLLLEEAYVQLLPWISGHPNLYILGESTERCCKNCGGTEFEGAKPYITPAGHFESMRCTKCGSSMRTRENLLTKKDKDGLLVTAVR